MKENVGSLHLFWNKTYNTYNTYNKTYNSKRCQFILARIKVFPCCQRECSLPIFVVKSNVFPIEALAGNGGENCSHRLPRLSYHPLLIFHHPLLIFHHPLLIFSQWLLLMKQIASLPNVSSEHRLTCNFLAFQDFLVMNFL